MWDPPRDRLPKGVRLFGGPWHNQIHLIRGHCIMGPTAIFPNGYISGPVGIYKYSTHHTQDGERYYDGWCAVWSPAHV